MFCNDTNFLFTNSANCKTEIDSGKPLKFVKIYVYSKIGEFCMFFFFHGIFWTGWLYHNGRLNMVLRPK